MTDEPVHMAPVPFDELTVTFDYPAAAKAARDPLGRQMIELLAPHPQGLIVLASLGIHIRSLPESTPDRSTPDKIVDRPVRSYAISTRDHSELDSVVLALVEVARIDPTTLTRADRIALHRAYLALSAVARAHGSTDNVALPVDGAHT